MRRCCCWVPSAFSASRRETLQRREARSGLGSGERHRPPYAGLDHAESAEHAERLVAGRGVRGFRGLPRVAGPHHEALPLRRWVSSAFSASLRETLQRFGPRCGLGRDGDRCAPYAGLDHAESAEHAVRLLAGRGVRGFRGLPRVADPLREALPLRRRVSSAFSASLRDTLQRLCPRCGLGSVGRRRPPYAGLDRAESAERAERLAAGRGVRGVRGRPRVADPLHDELPLRRWVPSVFSASLGEPLQRLCLRCGLGSDGREQGVVHHGPSSASAATITSVSACVCSTGSQCVPGNHTSFAPGTVSARCAADPRVDDASP